MKITCQKCGKSYDGFAAYCPYCGSANQNIKRDSQNVYEMQNSESVYPAGNKHSIHIVPIIIACLLSVSVILGFLFWIMRQQEKPSVQTSDTESLSRSVGADSEEDSTAAGGTVQLTAESSLTAPADLPDCQEVTFVSGEASSVLAAVNELYHYEPGRAFDGDTVTSWQEGNKNTDGENEWLELSTDQTYNIKYLTLFLGNWRDKDRYNSNNRPTELRIDIGEETFVVEFADVMKPQYVIFSGPVEANKIRLTLSKIKVGTNNQHDCCISEVRAFSSSAASP